ncbi:sensor histidine kinase [Janthinobacterium sp. PC23-8]|uniref:sensor histidine kinase n=1 Tax=Janthinobacterium sp. PC23-8 TaxID=2012679 RepID=UPI000B970F35|nr:sensor histidine kinase [Janthinobacterium sp. PC23-8]OYO30933.1 hypothetical protein CD932_07190 [Janthinobacterium sp. PC23-8]
MHTTRHPAPSNDVRLFAASMIHELSQPLAAVTLNAESALRGFQRSLPHDHITAALDSVLAAVAEASAMLHSMHRLASGARPDRLACCLDAMIRTTLHSHRAQLRSLRIRVDTDLTAPQCYGDPVQLQQVLQNLVANAIDAMRAVEDRPRILGIRAVCDERGTVLVTVSDSGCGIAPALLQNLFDPLVTSKPHGMGMGLAICRSIVELHGGEIRVDSNPAHGSTFTFSLPMTEHQPSAFLPAPKASDARVKREMSWPA